MIIELATQQEAAFLALEAQEHVEVLEQIAVYSQRAVALMVAGCSKDEIQASLGVN